MCKLLLCLMHVHASLSVNIAIAFVAADGVVPAVKCPEARSQCNFPEPYILHCMVCCK